MVYQVDDEGKFGSEGHNFKKRMTSDDKETDACDEMYIGPRLTM